MGGGGGGGVVVVVVVLLQQDTGFATRRHKLFRYKPLPMTENDIS